MTEGQGSGDFEPNALEIFEQLLDCEADQRAAVLAELTGGDAQLRQRVEGLLRADAASAGVGGMLDAGTPSFEQIDGLPLEPLASGVPDGPRFGDFVLGALLGAGGMGQVHEAWQLRPRRRVALKRLGPHLDGTKDRRRFELEAELLGRLRHRAIASVYAAGTQADGDRDVPWCALELVAGARDIASYWRTEQTPLKGRLEQVRAVAEGIAHAHARGVLHRDLKPVNVLVNESGQPKIIDFGIGRGPTREFDRTRTGELLGTLAWAAPEQLAGEPDGVDARADVYGLGALLHVALTGAGPRATITDLAALLEAAKRPLPPLSGPEGQALPRDLVAVARMALEPSPQDRYPTAQAFLTDLERHLDGRPVEARDLGAFEACTRFVGRHRLATSFAASVVLLIVLGLVGTSLGLSRALRAEELQREAAEEAERRAVLAEAGQDFLVRVIAAPRADRSGSDVTLAEVMDGAVAELDSATAGDPRVARFLHHTFADTYAALDRPQQALEQYQNTLALLQADKGADPLESVRLALDMGWFALCEAEFESAARAFDEAAAGLAPARELHGAEYVAEFALRLDFQRAELLWKRGELNAARAAFQELRAVGAELETSHDYVADSYTHEALAAQAAGDLEDALQLAGKSVAAFELSGGADSPRAAMARLLQANMCLGLNRLQEAEQLLDGLHLELAEAFGPAHSETLAALATLGELRLRQGRAAEAVALSEQAWSATREARGPGHWDSFVHGHNTAYMQLDLGLFEEAQANFEQLIEARLAVGGASDLLAVDARDSLSRVHVRRGRTAVALELLEHNLMLLEADPTLDPARLIEAHLGLGNVLEISGRPATAAGHFAQALPGLAVSFGAQHPRVQGYAARLADYCAANGDPELAADYRELAEGLSVAVPGGPLPGEAD